MKNWPSEKINKTGKQKKGRKDPKLEIDNKRSQQILEKMTRTYFKNHIQINQKT